MNRVGKRIGCVAIISAAAVTAGLSVHHDLQFLSPDLTASSIAGQTAQLQQLECLYQAIRIEVPKGATVYVNYPRAPITDRLSELSTAWAVPQERLADAEYRLTLAPARGHHLYPFPLTGTPLVPAQGQCDGITIKAQRLW
jgi:hypothetical protein